MVHSAVYNAFLNTLTTGVLFPCVAAAMQQWEWHNHVFPSKWPLFVC